MTPAYFGQGSLNVLEEGLPKLQVSPETAITPAVLPDIIPKAYFLAGQIVLFVTSNEDAGDLRALRESLGAPADDLDWKTVRKELDL
jgi:hypothetical protein